MSKPFKPNDEKESITRESIIGLGETSFRKNYYPSLQREIALLEQLNSQYRTLIETIPDILLVGNPQGELHYFSTDESEHTKLAGELLQDAEIVRSLQENIHKAHKQRVLVTHDFTFLRRGDAEQKLYLEARINITASGEALIIIRNMTERVQIEMKLRESAEKDSLTKIYSRAYFVEHLEQFHGKYMENFTLLSIDVDGLKIVNDTLGHPYGDALLIAFAKIVTQVFGEIGCAARIGGDEFSVFLQGYAQEQIETLLESMQQAIEAFNQQSAVVKLSVSSGYSYVEKGFINTNRMYHDADNKMYQNKLLKESSNKSGLVKSLMKALEAKDYITEGHADRLEELAIQMGESMHLPQNQMDRIKLLAKFHDIGKVGIPDKILQKPARLTAEEFNTMKTHSVIGKRIAESSNELKEIAELIFLHHERWDGKGYPMGLQGEDIPIECRIISIADTYDAMTNDRPYRKALSHEVARAELLKCAGTQFDARLVEIFLRAADKNA